MMQTTPGNLDVSFNFISFSTLHGGRRWIGTWLSRAGEWPISGGSGSNEKEYASCVMTI